MSNSPQTTSEHSEHSEYATELAPDGNPRPGGWEPHPINLFALIVGGLFTVSGMMALLFQSEVIDPSPRVVIALASTMIAASLLSGVGVLLSRARVEEVRST